MNCDVTSHVDVTLSLWAMALHLVLMAGKQSKISDHGAVGVTDMWMNCDLTSHVDVTLCYSAMALHLVSMAGKQSKISDRIAVSNVACCCMTNTDIYGL